MSRAEYKIHATTKKDEGDTVLNAVEIKPPISKALAFLACEKIAEYCEGPPVEDSGSQSGLRIELTPYGFCDEGATVSTLLRFNVTPVLIGGRRDHTLMALDIEHQTAQVISPSGTAILKSME